MAFKKGDIIKRPSGSCKFEVKNMKTMKRYGKTYLAVRVHNLDTGRVYDTSPVGFKLYNPFSPKRINRKDLKYDFENGV